MLTKVFVNTFILLSAVWTLIPGEKATVYRFYHTESSHDVSTCARQTVVMKQYEGDPTSEQTDVVAIKNTLNYEISSLKKQLKNQSDEISGLEKRLESTFSAIRNGFQILDDGWVGLFNGYQYKSSITLQSYDESKEFCKQNGADVAVYGVQDIGNRRIIKNALGPNLTSPIFIGLTDVGYEGTWKWINGNLLTPGEAFWGLNEPNGGQGHDCGFMSYADLLNYDYSCSSPQSVLCEKRWNS